MTRQQQLQNQLQAQKSKESSVEDLKKCFPFFKTSENEDLYSGKLAIKNIRIALKQAFPTTKFSVRNTDYGTIYITWTDGASPLHVEKLVSFFKVGRYCPDEDYHYCDPSEFHRAFGGVQYISYSRKCSDALIQRAINIIWRINFKNKDKPSVEAFRKGALYQYNLDRFFRNGLQSEVYQISSKLRG